MPEKWEIELRRLRRVDRPSGLEDRIEEGPRFEPGRPMRERVTAAVVAFAVCAAVGVVGFQALRDDDATGRQIGDGETVSTQTSVVLELSSNADGPTATVRYGDREQEAVFEGATWCPDGEPPPAPSGATSNSPSTCTSYIADFAFYPPVGEFLVVPPGTPIDVVGPATIGEMLVTDPNGEPFPAATGIPVAVPGDDGMFVYDVHAVWPQGTGDFFFGVQTLGDPANAPDVLTLDCTSVVARLDTAVVRTQPDGLHLRIVGDTDGFAIGTPGPDGTGEPTSAIGGTEQGSVPLRPGRWGITCGRDAFGSLLAPFELIDPDDHYAPHELTCDDVETSTFVSSVPVEATHEEAATQLVTGLASGDRLRGAGYGAETWRLGPTYVVERGREVVARLVLGSEFDVWSGQLETCGSTGVGLSDAATGGSGSTGAADVADELVVRCEGLGPALDTPLVRLQGDGLHVEATNVADAETVVIEDASGELLAGSFAEVTQRFVVQLAPGVYWFGCRVLDEDGEVDGNHLDRPEAYVEFEVLPEEG